MPQGQTESGGIVLAAHAEPRVPSGGVTLKRRCTYRPSVIYLIVNKLLSLSLYLSLSLSLSLSSSTQARANELIAKGDGYIFVAAPRSPDLRHTEKRRRHLCLP